MFRNIRYFGLFDKNSRHSVDVRQFTRSYNDFFCNASAFCVCIYSLYIFFYKENKKESPPFFLICLNKYTKLINTQHKKMYSTYNQHDERRQHDSNVTLKTVLFVMVCVLVYCVYYYCTTCSSVPRFPVSFEPIQWFGKEGLGLTRLVQTA